MSAPEPELAAFIREHGLAADGEEGEWTPLSGGVSSDIWKVETSSQAFCVKRALAQLRVAAEWNAPVERNCYEWAYLQVASEIAPGSVPRPLAHDRRRGLFAMEWLAPERHPLWKTDLLAGKADTRVAAAVGDLIGRIHGATARQPSILAEFKTDASFHAIRIEPYLLTTAGRHPDLAARIEKVAQVTQSTHKVLVHGDVSPKNILVGPAGPILLDAEVAWFGDPAFDLAFCLNHLLIKARVIADARRDLGDCYDSLARTYLAHVDWEDPAALEARSAALLPVLTLARVDGKSPVEYLDAAQRDDLRAVARRAIIAQPATLTAVKQAVLAGD